MKDAIETRYNELRQEHKRGTAMLARMDKEREALAQTLRRVEGAVQVLAELMSTAQTEAQTEAQAEGGEHAINR